MRRLIDITRPLLEPVPVYPGDCVPSSEPDDHSGEYLTNRIHLSTHSGTHIDAPVHFLQAGIGVDKISLDNLVGPCRVLDFRAQGNRITKKDLSGKLSGATRVLIRTKFSGTRAFSEKYPSLDIPAVEEIIRAGIRCFGTDSPSVEPYDGDGSIHRLLLGNGCPIIELLDLSGVEEGDYFLVALPLRLAGLDGSPARVILMELEQTPWT